MSVFQRKVSHLLTQVRVFDADTDYTYDQRTDEHWHYYYLLPEWGANSEMVIKKAVLVPTGTGSMEAELVEATRLARLIYLSKFVTTAGEGDPVVVEPFIKITNDSFPADWPTYLRWSLHHILLGSCRAFWIFAIKDKLYKDIATPDKADLLVGTRRWIDRLIYGVETTSTATTPEEKEKVDFREVIAFKHVGVRVTAMIDSPVATSKVECQYSTDGVTWTDFIASPWTNLPTSYTYRYFRATDISARYFRLTLMSGDATVTARLKPFKMFAWVPK